MTGRLRRWIAVISLVAVACTLVPASMAQARSSTARRAPAQAEPILRLVEEKSTIAADGTATFTVSLDNAPAGSVLSLDVYLPIGNDPAALASALRGVTRGQPFFPGLRVDPAAVSNANAETTVPAPTVTTTTSSSTTTDATTTSTTTGGGTSDTTTATSSSITTDATTTSTTAVSPAAPTVAEGPRRIVLTVPTKEGEPNAFRLRAAGVYPVLIRLMSGRDILTQLTTFLVRADTTSRPTEVAIVFPVDAAPTVQPDGRRIIPPAAKAQLEALDRLGQLSTVEFTLAVRADLLTALESSADADERALSQRLKIIAKRSQLVIDTAVPLDPTAAIRGGLAETYTRQITAGRAQLSAWLGREISDSGTRFITTTPEPAGLALARSAGLATLITPSGLANDAPLGADQAPTNGPVGLVDSNGAALGPGIIGSGGFEQLLAATHPDPPLAARQFLAGLEVQAPFANGPQTGVVLVAPLDWNAPAGGVLERLHTLLATSSMVRPVKVDQLLADVPAARTDAGSPVIRPLRAGSPTPVTDTGVQIALVQIDLASWSSMNPTPGVDPTPLLEAAASSVLSADQRRAYLLAAKTPTDALRTAIEPIEARQFNTKAGRVQLPVRLTSAITTPLRVRLHVASTKASFPENDQVVTLINGLYQGWVLLDAREGKYPVTLTVSPPVGDQVLATATHTVNAFAWGGLGLALTVGFGAVIGTWWFSHARAARRRKRSLADAQLHPAAAGTD